MSGTERHYYEIYGLTLAADLPLGTLPLREIGSTETDITVEMNSRIDVAPQDAELMFSTVIGDQELRVTRSGSGVLWSYPDQTRFWISEDASLVRCSWPTHFTSDDAATYLLGPILGFVLRRRGVVSLHASTISIAGTAVAILGPAGAGKSTLAAALIGRGHQLVSEDVTALRNRGGWRVRAGLPFVKLWPDSGSMYGDLPTLTPNWDKRYLESPGAGDDVPLGALVMLDQADSTSVSALSPRDALVRVLDNVYVPYALTSRDRAQDLEFLGGLVEVVPARQLRRTRSFLDLTVLCETLERMMESL